MPNNYNVASSVLKKAAGAIIDRAGRHGDTERSFNMVGQLWQTYLSHTFAIRKSTQITPYDVAKMLGMVKIARATYGHGEDNPVDEIGYAALGAMLNPNAIEDNITHEMEEKHDGASPV